MTYVVPLDELRFQASRAGGPGGQHVNKAATRIEVRWNVRESRTLTAAQRARLLDKLRTRIATDGTLRIAAEDHRSQWRNRAAAVERLQALVAGALRRPKPRKKTKPSRAAKERRLAEKRRRGTRKQQRRPVDPDE